MADESLAQLAERAFERHGDYESLCFDGEWCRSGALLERARRLASGLRERGVEVGDRVVVFAANSPDVPVVYNALWRAGAVVTPAVFLLSPTELSHIVDDAGARLVIASPEFEDTARESGVDVLSTSDLASLEQADPLDIVAREGTDLAALMYTGGTTGRAKGVMLTHTNLAQVGRAGHDSGYVPGVVRALTALPLSHAFGLLVTVIGFHTREPTTSVLMRWFEPTAWLELAQEHRVQIAAVVPSMLGLLLAQPLEDYDLSELRTIASGASPLPLELVDELERRLPGVEVREGYGLTETSGLVSATPPGRSRRGAVGVPVQSVVMRIVGEDGAEVPRGEVGEICCRSPFVMAGYWRAPEATAEAIRDGWLHTGDMGRIDTDGYLYVVDRKKDLIIRGGFNVFPRDVEEALLEHPAVAAVAVVGRPDAVHGEEVVAFVELHSGADATADAIVEFARTRIGGYKYPREVHVLPSLPLTAVGKLDRKALRTRVLEAAAR